jgi:hypothetical protein
LNPLRRAISHLAKDVTVRRPKAQFWPSLIISLNPNSSFFPFFHTPSQRSSKSQF